MHKPNLLLCLDAFGTLFRPRLPIATQYAQTARQCGLGGFSDDELRQSLAAAFRKLTKEHPNYGRATGLGATRWWGEVIKNTFSPILKSQPLPPDLTPRLIHRFSSTQGYTLEPDLHHTLQALKASSPSTKFNHIVVGVVTNSDDRVHLVLSSGGVLVGPLRYGSLSSSGPSPAVDSGAGDYDVDFLCTSYDVALEKPDPGIFQAAEFLAGQVLASRAHAGDEAPDLARPWERIYVGDELDKDVVGARNAGWKPVLLVDGSSDGPAVPTTELSSMRGLEDLTEKVVPRVESIRALATWLLQE